MAPPGADSGCPGHLLVSEKLDIWIFLATLAQHSGLVRGCQKNREIINKKGGGSSVLTNINFGLDGGV